MPVPESVELRGAGRVPDVAGPRCNALHARWRAITQTTALLAAVLLAGAGLFVAETEPRLFSAAELLPPDESLVGAFLPGGVMLAVTLVLARRLARIPVAVAVEPEGLRLVWGDGRLPERYPWNALHLDDAGWEGIRLRLETGTGGVRARWVTRELGDALRLDPRAPPEPAAMPRPER